MYLGIVAVSKTLHSSAVGRVTFSRTSSVAAPRICSLVSANFLSTKPRSEPFMKFRSFTTRENSSAAIIVSSIVTAGETVCLVVESVAYVFTKTLRSLLEAHYEYTQAIKAATIDAGIKQTSMVGFGGSVVGLHGSASRPTTDLGEVDMVTKAKVADLHTCIAHGQRQVLETLVSYHNSRRMGWSELCVAKTNDTPLHVAVRALRVRDLVWMVEAGGFSAGLVMKNVYNHDVIKHMKEAKKLLSKMSKYRKKALKAAKTGIAAAKAMKGKEKAAPSPAKRARR